MKLWNDGYVGVGWVLCNGVSCCVGTDSVSGTIWYGVGGWKGCVTMGEAQVEADAIGMDRW